MKGWWSFVKRWWGEGEELCYNPTLTLNSLLFVLLVKNLKVGGIEGKLGGDFTAK
jgi:hypothetical protein